jgi:hypothetical protein
MLDFESIVDSAGSPVMNCRIFSPKPTLLFEADDITSRVSAVSLRVLIGAIGGGEAAITSDTVSNQCNQFEFEAFARHVEAGPAKIEAEERRELGALTVEERRQYRLERGELQRESLKAAKKHERLVSREMERGGVRHWIEQGPCDCNTAAKRGVGKVVERSLKREEDLGNVGGKRAAQKKEIRNAEPVSRSLAPRALN